EDVATLEDEHAASRAREVGGADEPVVPSADDDRVVALRLHDRLRSGLKNGLSTTRAVRVRRWYSTVCSILRLAPTAECAASTLAIARFFFRIGDQVPLVARPTCPFSSYTGTAVRQAVAPR